jgi:nicotinamidase-related amidase
MQNKALLIIDIQNDITKNYKDIIGNINKSIDWAVENKIHVVYIRQEYVSETMKKFKPNTRGSELVPELKIASENIFTKNLGSVLSSIDFSNFIEKNKINEFYLTGADAVACVKSSNYNLLKAGFKVNVLTDCITSYDKKKIGEMLEHYASKGSNLTTIDELRFPPFSDQQPT